MLAGWYEFRWDGRDEQGQFVSSGVYFAELRTSGGTFTYKMALVR